jgi:hypothetical protein
MSSVAAARRPLLPRSQISSLSLPPLLIPAPQPQPIAIPASQHFSRGRVKKSHTTHHTSTSSSSKSHHSSSIASPNTSESQASSSSAHLRTREHSSRRSHHSAHPDSNIKINTDPETMSTAIPEIILSTRKAASGIPGEEVEPRQVLPTETASNCPPTGRSWSRILWLCIVGMSQSSEFLDTRQVSVVRVLRAKSTSS